MDKNYTFSVIVPYFNVRIDWLNFCLNSLLSQDLNLLKEIVIVNDGSNEQNKNNLIELVNELPHTHESNLIKIIHQNNMGIAGARKTGFYNSTGEIVLFVDSDDWIANTNWIQNLNKHFNRHANVDIISFLESNNQDFTISNNDIFSDGIEKVINTKWYFNDVLRSERAIPTWKYAYKRHLLNDLNFWHNINQLSEDWYFMSYLLSKETKGLMIKEQYYCHRMNPDSITQKSSLEHKLIDILIINNNWFKTNPKWNINSNKIAKEFWIWIQIALAIWNSGFRHLISIAKMGNVDYATLKDIKFFLKKYKPLSGIKWICMKLMVYVNFCDKFFPKFYKKFI